MHFAPLNEQGVVFLFAHLAKRWRLTVEEIRKEFPDCIAYQKIGGREKRVRIEFEYESRNFRQHGHNPRGADWVVCWEHNWPGAPSHLRIVELRREFGLGFNVWVQPVGEDFKDALSRISYSDSWSVPSRASEGDLLLFYHTAPESALKDVFRLVGSVNYQKAGWKPGMDYGGPIRRVCKLRSPVFLEDLRRDRVLSTAGFVRSKFRARPVVTEYWPYLHQLILRRNPAVTRKLAPYAPENL